MTRRGILTVALLAATIAALPATPVSAARSPMCNYNWRTTSGVRQIIRCATNRYPVPGGVSEALYIAHRESGFRYHATNPHTGACGIYQHMPRLWPARVARWYWGPDRSCYNGRTNVLVSIRMVHAGGWGPWHG